MNLLQPTLLGMPMSVLWLVCLGLISGAGAGLLAGLIGIGGGVVIVPVIYYGLTGAGAAPDQAAHVAVATSLAAILPAALASSVGHWRAGNTDFAFLREWGPGIAIGVVAAQLVAPHLRGSFMTARWRRTTSHSRGVSCSPGAGLTRPSGAIRTTARRCRRKPGVRDPRSHASSKPGICGV